MSPPVAASALSRRDFLARLGGYGSVFTALTGMGLLSRASGQGADLSGLPSVAGKSKTKVVILGAGIAGMTAAYELGKLGFDCTILEARQSAGGRCMTLRGGDVVEETNGFKQTCQYDDGQYFNPGPSRFPQWHVTMDYCRELGVEVEPFINLNENAYYYMEGEAYGPLAGKRIRIREAKTDLRGYTAELLAKVADPAALEANMTDEDKERLLSYLRAEGGLNRAYNYEAHPRRGYATWPGGGTQKGELGEAYAGKDLLMSEVWKYFHRANEYQYQAQMYTPKGGMDHIAKALAAKVKDQMLTGAVVKEFRKTNPGARVVYTLNGEEKEITADYAIVTLPPTILRKLPNDFSPLVKNTINVVPFQNSGKVGMQFKRRFWEEDDRIFGGLSWTNLPIGEIWYPSSGYLGKKGIMGGYYVFGPISDELGKMEPKDRIEFALKHGEKVHPQYRKEFENAVAFNWATVPYIEGCLAHFPEAMIDTFYPFLIKPDAEFYIAASWASHVGGWQAGSFEGARLAVKSIHERTMAA